MWSIIGGDRDRIYSAIKSQDASHDTASKVADAMWGFWEENDFDDFAAGDLPTMAGLDPDWVLNVLQKRGYVVHVALADDGLEYWSKK